MSFLPSAQVAQKVQPDVLPRIAINEYGAVSMLGEGETGEAPKVFENVDGKRINDGRYDAFAKDLSGEQLRPPAFPACYPH